VNVKALLKEVRSIDFWSDVPSIPLKRFLYSPTTNEMLTTKNLVMSEILVPLKVPKKYIKAIYTPEKYESEVRNLLKNEKGAPPIITYPDMFFEPERQVELFPGLWVVYGDMFFADTEVLTISVNVVGVMGKGSASRFKYMFHEAYIVYQELCKNRILDVGKPYLLEYGNSKFPKLLKFLLFPTKRHWKERSKIEYISKGLNYFKEKVQTGEWKMESIAFPALGCGLGGLKWEDVGPLMVKELLTIVPKVKVYLYLPENKDDYFTKEFYNL